MSEPQVRISRIMANDEPADTDMGGDEGEANDTSGEVTEVLEVEAPTGEAQAEADEVIEAASAAAEQMSFIDYLKSPIIEFGVGRDSEAVTLTAHQGLLARSPFLVNALAQFSDDATSRRIEMPNEDLDAVGCFLQYLYTGEYYPKKLPGNRLELGGSDDGVQLLKHARVYTLARKLNLDELTELALSKVHLVQSTARGEIAYARFVYGNTAKTDERIRKPIAAFWGQRSHVLRHEAESEFKELCIEFPEFAFDVLTHVLDSKERRVEKNKEEDVTKSGRKRQRAG